MAGSDRSVTVPLSDQRRCASHTAVLASAADNPVGWHSIFLFSLVAGLVSIMLCFPGSDPLIGVLGALSIYSVWSVSSAVELVTASWAPGAVRRPAPQGRRDLNSSEGRGTHGREWT
jgi:hypothetical protein